MLHLRSLNLNPKNLNTKHQTISQDLEAHDHFWAFLDFGNPNPSLGQSRSFKTFKRVTS